MLFFRTSHVFTSNESRSHGTNTTHATRAIHVRLTAHNKHHVAHDTHAHTHTHTHTHTPQFLYGLGGPVLNTQEAWAPRNVAERYPKSVCLWLEECSTPVLEVSRPVRRLCAPLRSESSFRAVDMEPGGHYLKITAQLTQPNKHTPAHAKTQYPTLIGWTVCCASGGVSSCLV